MRFSSLIRTRLTSVLTTSALVAAGLAVTTLAAPVAAADTSPIVSTSASTVTADALPTVQIDGVVWDQAIAGNTVWAGGQFANARPAGAAAGTQLTTRNNLLAYDLTTGALITSINPSLNAQVKTVAVSPDGTRVYVGGTFTKANGANRYRLAAFDAGTGALITTFAPTINSAVNTIVATNTTVYVGGVFSSAGGQTRNRLAAFNASNGALTAWAPSADATVNAMVASPDGKIIAGGSFQNVNGSPAYGLAALDPTVGALQPWATTGLIRNAGTQAAILSLTSDGTSILGTGYVFGAGGNLEGTFSANPATGNINWVEDCHGDTYDAYSDGSNVYTVSHAHYCGNLGGFFQSNPWGINMRHALAFSTTATGTLGHDPYGYYDFYGTASPSLINWFPDLAVGSYTGKSQAAWSVTGNGEYVVMGGEFPRVNNVAQQGLVRFAVSSKAPNKVAPQIKGAAFNPGIIGLPSGAARISWQANWDMDDYSLTYKLTRDGTQIYQVDASSTFWNRQTMGYVDPSADLVPGKTYKYRLSATDAAGNVSQSETINFTAPAAGSTNAYATRVLADGASPYWPMNETSGTVLFDNSTAFNDADTGAGVTRNAAGAIAGDPATTFDGATSASTRTAIPGPNTYTSQVWIKTTTTSGGKILGFGGSSTGNSSSYDRHIYMDNAGHIYYGVYPNGVATLNSTGTYNDGQWHQITTSLGPDGMKLYIDAKLIAQRGDVTFGQDYSGYWRVGGDNIGGWPNQPTSSYFAGDIDEVAIYPTVLSSQMINAEWTASGRSSTIPAAPADPYGAAVFNDNPLLFWRLGEATGSSTATDSGQNGDQTGIYQNGVALGVAGGIKGTTNTAASFDGIDDLVASTNSFTNPKNYSEEAWFKTSTTNGGKIIGFGSSQTGTSGSYDRHVYMSNDGKVTFGTWTGITNTITSANALNDGQWHHVVATQSTTDGMKMYIDGALSGTNSQTDAQGYTGYWRVGGDNQWGCCSPFIQATIDDAAVYNSVLSPAQVANHFNLGNTVEAQNQAPSAAFASSAVYLDATFDASSSTDADGSITGYAWDFGDSSQGVGINPTHSYGEAGTYQVNLTVTDNKGETAVVTHPITVTAPPVNTPPTATFTVTPGVLSASVNAAGSADSDGTITGYAWDFGDGTTGTGVSTSHTYTAAGPFTITLVVTDDDGATGTTTQQVTISGPANQAPTPKFTATANQLTANVDASASTDDGSITSYAWDFGDGATGTGETTFHVYSTAGTKTIVLTVTDDQGASTSLSQPVEVTAPPVNTLPTANFTYTASGLTANLESTSTDSDGTIATWDWDFGGGQTASTSAVTHPFAAAGTYPVKLTVTDNDGGVGTVTKNVTVTAAPPANVAPTAAFTSTSSGLTAAVDGSTSSDSDGTIAAYSWAFGDGDTDMTNTATASHPYAAAGTYQVTLTVTDDGGLTNALTKSVTVSTPAPTPLVNDAFGRTSTNSWGSADVGGAWTVAGGATNFSVNDGTGKIRMNTAGAGPSVTSGALDSADTDAAVNISLDKPVTGSGVYVSLASRKIGNSEYRTTAKFLASGAVQLQVVKIAGGVSTTLRTVNVAGLTYAAGDVVTLRFQVSGTTSVSLNAKVWKSGTTEPAFQSVATDSSAPLTTAGSVALYPYLSGSATNAPVVASFDNLTIYAMAP